MMKLLLLIVVAFGVYAQAKTACKTYSNNLPDGSLGFCAGLIDYPYFVQSETTSQVELEKTAVLGVTANSTLVQKLLMLLPGTCSSALKKLSCQAAFPQCQEVDPYFVAATSPLPSPLALNETTCPVYGGTFKDGLCGVAFPVFPCKTQCDVIGSMNTTNAGGTFTVAKCPLVSGYLYGSLGPLQNSLDPAIKAEVISYLQEKSCAGPLVANATARCMSETFNANLLSMLGFAPDCMKTQAGFEIFPNNAQTFGGSGLAGFITSKIGDMDTLNSGDGNCGPPSNNSAIKCDDVRKILGCAPEVAAKASVQESYALSEPSGICHDIISSKNNNDLKLNGKLAGLNQAFNPAEQNCAAKSMAAYDNIYYVPSYPGQAPLGQRIDAGDHEAASASICTVDPAQYLYGTATKYTNFELTPLCFNADGTPAGYNSKDCLISKVTTLYGMFPKTADYKCTAAFQEYLCAQAQMKIQLNDFCMLRDGCYNGTDLSEAVDNYQLGFQFPVPRLASKKICKKFEDECAGTFAVLPPAQAALLRPNCDELIEVDECANPGLNVWSCESPLNGLEKFPSSTLSLANVSAISELQIYQTLYGVNLQPAFESTVVEPTITEPLYLSDPTASDLNPLKEGFCECPAPLVVPDDPFAPTVKEGFCCAIPCRGTMTTEEKTDTFGMMQMVLSSLGVVMALFMVLTWGMFKAKNKQYLTFWLSVCSFNVSLCFLAMAATANAGADMPDRWCFDNTQPNSSRRGEFSLCALQGAWLHFWALAECGWWFCQSLDLFRKLVLGHRNTDSSKAKYHILCWGIPLATVIVILAAAGYGYKAPSPYCFTDENTSTLVEWLAFYGWVAMYFVGGTFCMLMVVFVICKHVNKIDHGTSTSGKLRQKYKMYRTPMLFVMLFVFVWCMIFSFRLLLTFDEEDYVTQGASWILCLLTNFAYMPDPATNSAANNTMVVGKADDLQGCGIVQSGGVPQGFLTATFTLILSQSILIFVIFGMHAENYRLWAGRCGCSSYADNSQHGFTTSQGSKDMSSSKYQVANSSYYQSTSQQQGSQYGGFNAKAPGGAPPAPPPSLPNDYY